MNNLDNKNYILDDRTGSQFGLPFKVKYDLGTLSHYCFILQLLTNQLLTLDKRKKWAL